MLRCVVHSRKNRRPEGLRQPARGNAAQAVIRETLAPVAVQVVGDSHHVAVVVAVGVSKAVSHILHLSTRRGNCDVRGLEPVVESVGLKDASVGLRRFKHKSYMI
jgi:hypothetical protein